MRIMARRDVCVIGFSPAAAQHNGSHANVHAADLLELDTMNRATELTKALDEPITDGRYRLYDFGVHDFSDTTSLWVGTTGGVDPKNV